MDIFFKKYKLPKNYKGKGLQLVNNQLRYDNMDAATKLKYKNTKELIGIQRHVRKCMGNQLLKGKLKGEARGIIRRRSQRGS